MRLLPLLIPCLLVVSCATDKKDHVTPLAAKTMNQRFNGKPIKQDADGNWPAEVKGANLPETNRKSAYFTGDSNLPKAYKAGEYTKNAWWGGKTIDRQPYSGNTDGSRFQKAATSQQKGAREAGMAANTPGAYQTGAYQTGNARETGRERIAKPLDARTENRRGVTPEPEVVGWEEQRRVDVKTIKDLMGRN